MEGREKRRSERGEEEKKREGRQRKGEGRQGDIGGEDGTSHSLHIRLGKCQWHSHSFIHVPELARAHTHTHTHDHTHSLQSGSQWDQCW